MKTYYEYQNVLLIFLIFFLLTIKSYSDEQLFETSKIQENELKNPFIPPVEEKPQIKKEEAKVEKEAPIKIQEKKIDRPKPVEIKKKEGRTIEKIMIIDSTEIKKFQQQTEIKVQEEAIKAQEKKEEELVSKMVLTGIVINGYNKSAILDRRIVRIGDEFGIFTIVDIVKNKIILSTYLKTYTLYIKKKE